MELRHLRYFSAVAEHGGVGTAARILHVAQSAISEQIRDLESELEVALFDRSHRRIRLTEAGEQFLRDARLVLAAADRAVANVKKSVAGELGTLTVGFFVGGTGSFLSAILKEFRRRFPEVQVSLVEMAPGMQHKALEDGSIDIAFTRPVQPAYATRLRAEPFRIEPLFAVLPRSHALAASKRLLLRDLAGETFILNDRSHSPSVFDRVITLCAEAGFSPRIGSTATVSSGVIALVEAGDGIAILPEGSRRLGTDDVVFVPLGDAGAVVELVIAWSWQQESPVIGSFLEVARRWARRG